MQRVPLRQLILGLQDRVGHRPCSFFDRGPHAQPHEDASRGDVEATLYRAPAPQPSTDPTGEHAHGAVDQRLEHHQHDAKNRELSPLARVADKRTGLATRP